MNHVTKIMTPQRAMQSTDIKMSRDTLDAVSYEEESPLFTTDAGAIGITYVVGGSGGAMCV